MSLNPLEIIFSLSLGVAVFFLRSFYNKLDKTIESFGEKLESAATSINELNKNVAVAVNNQTHLTERLKKSENEIERLWKSSDKIKDTLHDIRSEMTQ